MNTSFVPSLQHLTCSRLIGSIFNHLEVQKNYRDQEFENIKCQVKEAIPCLTPCTRLQEKLEVFIDPLLREIEDCLSFFDDLSYTYEPVSRAVEENIPQCWLSDGTIDREKLARFVVKKKGLHSVNRFVFACTFCFFSDALDLWNVLLKIDKAYLKCNGSAIVKLWIEWLESSSEKDWESFVIWILGTPLWRNSVPFLKHALKTISPEERSLFLLNALIEKQIGDGVMRFCLSVMTKDEQDQIYRNSTVQVLRCMLSWPLRPIFFDMANNVWPYFTERSFCSALHMFLRMIKTAERKDTELLIILENFWAESPELFQNAAKDDPVLFSLAEETWYKVSLGLLNPVSPQSFWKIILGKIFYRLGRMPFKSQRVSPERFYSHIREIDVSTRY